MIQVEYLNNGTLVRHYSDAGFMLLQNETGDMYADPIDLFPCKYTYTETNEPVEASEVFISGDEFMGKVEEVL